MSKAELPVDVVEQHIGWLRLYLESMTADNWQDNKARGLRQLAELSTDARKIIAAETERCAKIAETGCLVPPDGGSPTEEERLMCEGIAKAIRGASSSAMETKQHG